jgi:type III pantothenate kinase
VEAALVRAGLRVLLVGRDVPVPIGIRYDTPSTLGTDRLLSALAASSMAQGRAFVLSAGTAITGDWVDEEGVFRGGAIAPGLGALVGALAASLPHLPRPRVPLSVSYPGVSSQESVDAGCRAAFLGTVRALHRAAEQAAGGPLPAVVTGGDAVTAAAALEDTVVLVVPHLPLLGLARMARDLLARNAWMRAPGV